MSNYYAQISVRDSHCLGSKELGNCKTSKVKEVYDSFKIENLTGEYDISGPWISLAVKSLDKKITSFKVD